MKTTRSFEPADRYIYDFGLCHYKKGWAQVDTGQDASYFGTWASPGRLAILTYCEGDVTLLQADDADEFIVELRAIKTWNETNGHGFRGIDGMMEPTIIDAFTAMGAADLLH
jgi:hypothetical protein